LSWLSIQNGAGVKTRSRRLVKSLPLPLPLMFQQPTSILFSSHLSHPTLKPSNVLIDAISMTLINGSTIDFATELIGSSFRVLSNPQAKGSGCGCGISWELK
jgi:hypothetical protein